MNAIEIRNLTKRFPDQTAVDGISMTVPEGAIYGFIGENGSGKSTTEKMICGLLPPTSGEIKILGKDYKDQTVRSQMGVLIETPGCYPNVSVWNNMKLEAHNLGMRHPDEEIRKVLRLVHMEGAAGNKYKNCSLGMKQRVGIAMALLGSPKLLVLDEPLNGLDADGVRILREVLLDLSHQGVTILISSHLLDELEKIATHYGIIQKGILICEMTAEELHEDCPLYSYVRVSEQDEALALLNEKYRNVALNEQKTEIRIPDSGIEDIISLLHENGITPESAGRRKISLADYYLKLMERKN